MHLVLCGTGTPIADPQRAGPCTAVLAAGRLFLVDLGPGGWKAADLAGLPLTNLEGVLLTTFLADDMSDLGEAMTRSWIVGRHRRVPIHGPPGTAALVTNLVALYSNDAVMRAARHDRDVLEPRLAPAEPREFTLDGPDGTSVVFDTDGLRITAFSVGDIGDVPSVGYRFEYGGRSIVIAGHQRRHPNLLRQAREADLLVHEAAAPAMIERAIRIMDSIGEVRLATFSREMLGAYASPVEVAEVARAAHVRTVVLTRLYPPPKDWVERLAFMRGVREIFADVVLGEDGMRFRLDPR